MRELRIGALAKLAGVGIDTVRHYERIGLLPSPPRAASGYRSYDRRDAERLRFIRRGRELGFSLDEIAMLLALRGSDVARAADVLAITRAKMQVLGRRIADLAAIERALTSLADDCPPDAPASDCPILAHLSGSTGIMADRPLGSDDLQPSRRSNPMDMKRCIELCIECHRVCTEAVAHCLSLGGKHAAPEHIGALLDCAQLCATSADLMLRGSSLHGAHCAVCAEACRLCAESCEALDGEHMRRCAEACRACERSCREMGSHAHHHA